MNKFLCFSFFFMLLIMSFKDIQAKQTDINTIKYSLLIPYKTSIVSLSKEVGFDKIQNELFIRGVMSDKTRDQLLSIYPDQEDQKKINALYQFQHKEYWKEYWPELVLYGTPVIAMMACPPLFGSGMLLSGCIKFNEKPVSTTAYRIQGFAKRQVYTNDQYIYQPMSLLNAAFFAINLDPWLCILGNISGLTLFSQNSPIHIYEASAFPCSTFDKALYESSLMSEELWAEFKLADYYNDQDQLNDKFFKDYEAKALKIPDKFKPYEAGIYEGIAAYLKAQKDKTPTEKK